MAMALMAMAASATFEAEPEMAPDTIILKEEANVTAAAAAGGGEGGNNAPTTSLRTALLVQYISLGVVGKWLLLYSSSIKRNLVSGLRC